MSDYKIDLEDLSFTQSRRRQLVKALEKNILENEELSLSADDKVIGNYTKLLDGMDKQVIALKRLQQESEEGDKNRQAAETMHEMLIKLERDKVNPFKADPNRQQGVPVIEQSKIPHKETIAGELDMDGEELSWNNFSRQFEK